LSLLRLWFHMGVVAVLVVAPVAAVAPARNFSAARTRLHKVYIILSSVATAENGLAL